MRHRFLISVVAVLAAVPALSKTAPAPRPIGVEASIAFADSIGIYNFRADGDEAIWLQDQRKRWYHARLFAPCIDLPYAQAIGVDTSGGSSLDKFGSIIVGRDRCRLMSLVTSEGPPKKAKKAKAAS